MKKVKGRRTVNVKIHGIPARRGRAREDRSLSAVVMPLQPPFTQEHRVFEFADWDKKLAVSMVDAAQIEALMQGGVVGRTIVLENAGYGRVRISVTQ
jgi:hypothetical protein